MLDGTTIVYSSAPAATTSPALTVRLATTPLIGATTVASPSALRAVINRLFALATSDSSRTTSLRAASTLRSATAPAATSFSARASSRRASSSACSCERTEDSAEVTASPAVLASMRASSWPRRTACPCSSATETTAPPTSARTVAWSFGASVPETTGPVMISSVATFTVFSTPMSSTVGAAAFASP